MQVGSKNIMNGYEMRGVKIKSVHAAQDLDVTVASNLKVSQQCDDSVRKVNRMMSLIERKFSFKNKNVVLPFYNIICIAILYYEYAVQFSSPHHEKDIVVLEGVQRTATKTIPPLRNKPYEERLPHLNLFPPGRPSLRGKLIECFKIQTGFTKLFVMDDSTRSRNNGAELRYTQVHSDCTKFFFTNAVVRDWKRLPLSAVQCNATASFKNNLDRCLRHLNVH